jgi:hypothetical protein
VAGEIKQSQVFAAPGLEEALYLDGEGVQVFVDEGLHLELPNRRISKHPG